MHEPSPALPLLVCAACPGVPALQTEMGLRGTLEEIARNGRIIYADIIYQDNRARCKHAALCSRLLRRGPPPPHRRYSSCRASSPASASAGQVCSCSQPSPLSASARHASALAGRTSGACAPPTPTPTPTPTRSIIDCFFSSLLTVLLR